MEFLVPNIFLAVILFFSTAFFTHRFISFAKERNITDVPNERSSHKLETPRGGGLGFVIFSIMGFLGVAAFQDALTIPVGITIFIISLMALLGWFDDRFDLSSSKRFLIQIGLAIAILITLGPLEFIYIPGLDFLPLYVAGWIVSIIWIVGVANIYNFMDGIDGISSVQAIAAAIGWAFVAWIFWNPLMLAFSFIIMATVLAFLLFNWSPAKIFMGDVGSVFLGFYFAVFPFLSAEIMQDEAQGVYIWVSALVLWPFLFDGAFTIIRRLINKENIFEAHRSHLYQRLNIIGWSHAKITSLYGVLCVCSVLAMLAFLQGAVVTQIGSLSFLILMMLALVFTVQTLEKSQK